MSHPSTLIEQAKQFAIARHEGHQYGSHPYSFHLEMVALIAKANGADEEQIAAAWLHDSIEDAGVTYEDISQRFGVKVADIVWALTGIGQTRLERVLDAVEKIERTPGAGLVKLADRFANVSTSITDHQSRFARRYVSEHPLMRAIFPECELKDRLDKLIAVAKHALQDNAL